jgi:tetratricopeptide (TPR) repeat protein
LSVKITSPRRNQDPCLLSQSPNLSIKNLVKHIIIAGVSTMKSPGQGVPPPQIPKLKNTIQPSNPGALRDYTRAIELNPSEPGSYDFDSAITYVHRAMALYELGDGKRARQDFSQALLIRPCLTCAGGPVTASQVNKAEGFLRKGLALLRRGDKAGSRENLEKAATLFYADGDMPKYQNVKYQLSRF